MADLDEEQRRLQEKRELLKLKQGIIEESEIIPEDGYAELPKLRGWKWVENFIYHYKWIMLVVLFAAIIIGYMIYETVTREREDIYVLAIQTTSKSGMLTKRTDIEEALEKYCPDFDGNGYVHVGINFLDLNTENGYTELNEAATYKLSAEIITGDSQLYICDTGIMDLLSHTEAEGVEFFIKLAQEYPDSVFNDEKGLRLNTTQWKTEARWETCPDIVGLYVRDEFEDMTGNGKAAKEQRERALIVLDNIIKGNVVNPDPAG